MINKKRIIFIGLVVFILFASVKALLFLKERIGYEEFQLIDFHDHIISTQLIYGSVNASSFSEYLSSNSVDDFELLSSSRWKIKNNLKEKDVTIYSFGYDDDDDSLKNTYNPLKTQIYKRLFPPNGDVELARVHISDSVLLNYLSKGLICFIEKKRHFLDTLETQEIKNLVRLAVDNFYYKNFNISTAGKKFLLKPDATNICIFKITKRNNQTSLVNMFNGKHVCLESDVTSLLKNFNLINSNNDIIIYLPVKVASNKDALFFI